MNKIDLFKEFLVLNFLYEKFNYNLERYGLSFSALEDGDKDDIVANLSYIDRGFVWRETEEGFEFWNNINNLWENYGKENN